MAGGWRRKRRRRRQEQQQKLRVELERWERVRERRVVLEVWA
jgi:hypothetical protein